MPTARPYAIAALLMTWLTLLLEEFMYVERGLLSCLTYFAPEDLAPTVCVILAPDKLPTLEDAIVTNLFPVAMLDVFFG